MKELQTRVLSADSAGFVGALLRLQKGPLLGLTLRHCRHHTLRHYSYANDAKLFSQSGEPIWRSFENCVWRELNLPKQKVL